MIDPKLKANNTEEEIRLFELWLRRKIFESALEARIELLRLENHIALETFEFLGGVNHGKH